MAAKKKKKKKKRHPNSWMKHKPSPKARAAYNKLIVKSYNRLRATLKKHNPSALKGE